MKQKWKRNEKLLKVEQIENAVLISLWLEVKNLKQKEAKRSEKNGVFRVSVQNACETDLVSLRFDLKRKTFFAKLAHPNVHSIKVRNIVN